MRHIKTEIDSLPPGCPEWVTLELLNKTIQVWQPYYATDLKPEDALEIILNVGGLTKIIKECHSETICRNGSCQ
ncbi:hypothetical protein MNBD_PLANCTO02-3401 [hydrothermal vent metagenome]|uniref:Uncharacterized protein n=1 Tax=hydrothermal vent metagenome TaxID=652676 RepID=A0A3B1DD06_9ZZZZ